MALPASAKSVTPDRSRNWEDRPILKVEHLTMRFGGLVAIDDLSFTVGRGDITSLIGPNGAGKTTVFNCLTGFYKPTEGRMIMAHEPSAFDKVENRMAEGKRYWADDHLFLLERMPDMEICAIAKVARTFQNIRLFGGMTVLENLMVAQHNVLIVTSGYSFAGLFGLPSHKQGEREALDLAKYWLERTNLMHRADDPAADLPYGDQRRLEIARAMCTRPQILCLDEPAAGLNPRESIELNKLLMDIRDKEGISVLLIEHDMSVVMEISDHVIVLDYGQKIADGAPENVKNDPRVVAAYLGVDDDEVEAVEAEVEQQAAGVDSSGITIVDADAAEEMTEKVVPPPSSKTPDPGERP